jgi:Ca-activated chloride channel family protein
MIRVLLELVVHPIGKMDKLTIAHLTVNGDLLTAGAESVGLPLQINIPVSDKPDSDPPPDEIVSALSLIALYRMQDKARHEAELGQSSRAARRLENLATHLLANGERELARAALTEADRLNHTRRLSQEGEKFLKYGTRALLLPGRSEQS